MSNSRILIVDDDARISSLMHALLEKAGGYEVREENRSFAALSTAREFRPHLVLLDVDMPGKDGGQVATELAKDPMLCSTPIIFVTSLVSRSEAGRRGAKLFIAKPVDPLLLLETVRSMLPSVAA